MHVVVVAGGAPVDARWQPLLSGADRVIAADSGVAHALALHLHVDAVVGDLDSASAADVRAAQDAGARVERHPVDKDATDLELALEAAVRDGATAVTVAAIGGGRVDHFLANMFLLASARWTDITVDALDGSGRVWVLRGGTALVVRGRAGDLVSILPVTDGARGIRTTGLRWALHSEDLAPGSTRGVSNEMTGLEAHVAVDQGVVLVIQPEGRP